MSVFAAKSTALITGGASGIGLAVAQLCRKHGMKVAIADNNPDNLSKARQTLGSEDVEAYQIDVSDLNAWQDLKTKVEGKFGQVDLLHLNAGMGLRGTWGDDNYFQKVCVCYMAHAGRRVADAVALDPRYEPVRCRQRPQCFRAYLPVSLWI